MAQHEAATRAYWAAVQRRTGISPAVRPGLTTSQHIFYLLLTVFTGGLGIFVWIWQANRTVRPRTGGDPSAPMPEWPPPDPSEFG